VLKVAHHGVHGMCSRVAGAPRAPCTVTAAAPWTCDCQAAAMSRRIG
jgi:hypothetical protein